MKSETPKLFDDLPDAPMGGRTEQPKARARVLLPNRLQMELRPSDLESLLPEGHRADRQTTSAFRSSCRSHIRIKSTAPVDLRDPPKIPT